MKLTINGTVVEGTASELAAILKEYSATKESRNRTVAKKASPPVKIHTMEQINMDLMPSITRGKIAVPKKKKGTRARWTKAQITNLRTLAELKVPTPIIAKSLDRTLWAVRKRAYKSKISLSHRSVR